MTYRLKDRELQAELDEISDGSFSRRLACIHLEPDGFRTIWFSIGGRNASLLVFDDDIVWDEENEEDQTKEVQTP